MSSSYEAESEAIYQRSKRTMDAALSKADATVSSFDPKNWDTDLLFLNPLPMREEKREMVDAKKLVGAASSSSSSSSSSSAAPVRPVKTPIGSYESATSGKKPWEITDPVLMYMTQPGMAEQSQSSSSAVRMPLRPSGFVAQAVIPLGLTNQGNWRCWMNAPLQCFAALPIIREFCRTFFPPSELDFMTVAERLDEFAAATEGSPLMKELTRAEMAFLFAGFRVIIDLAQGEKDTIGRYAICSEMAALVIAALKTPLEQIMPRILEIAPGKGVEGNKLQDPRQFTAYIWEFFREFVRMYGPRSVRFTEDFATRHIQQPRVLTEIFCPVHRHLPGCSHVSDETPPFTGSIISFSAAENPTIQAALSNYKLFPYESPGSPKNYVCGTPTCKQSLRKVSMYINLPSILLFNIQPKSQHNLEALDKFGFSRQIVIGPTVHSEYGVYHLSSYYSYSSNHYVATVHDDASNKWWAINDDDARPCGKENQRTNGKNPPGASYSAKETNEMTAAMFRPTMLFYSLVDVVSIAPQFNYTSTPSQ